MKCFKIILVKKSDIKLIFIKKMRKFFFSNYVFKVSQRFIFLMKVVSISIEECIKNIEENVIEYTF